jgi:hypothetical protein
MGRMPGGLPGARRELVEPFANSALELARIVDHQLFAAGGTAIDVFPTADAERLLAATRASDHRHLDLLAVAGIRLPPRLHESSQTLYLRGPFEGSK